VRMHRPLLGWRDPASVGPLLAERAKTCAGIGPRARSGFAIAGGVFFYGSRPARAKTESAVNAATLYAPPCFSGPRPVNGASAGLVRRGLGAPRRGIGQSAEFGLSCYGGRVTASVSRTARLLDSLSTLGVFGPAMVGLSFRPTPLRRWARPSRAGSGGLSRTLWCRWPSPQR